MSKKANIGRLEDLTRVAAAIHQAGHAIDQRGSTREVAIIFAEGATLSLTLNGARRATRGEQRRRIERVLGF